MAYGIVEEGLALQSFFNPALYHAAARWGGLIFGINGVYTEAMLIYHPIWSIAIPVLLTDLLFPSRLNTPYLGRFGLVVTALFYVFGVLLTMLGAHTSLAPGYWAPPVLLGFAALAVLVLVVIALGVLPRAVPLPPLQTNAPQPWMLFLVSGIGSFACLALLLLLGPAVPAFTHAPLVLLSMLSALVLVAIVAWLVYHWSHSHTWSDNHLLALLSGALIAHTLVGILNSHDPTTRLGLVVLGLLMIILLILLARRIQARVTSSIMIAHSK